MDELILEQPINGKWSGLAERIFQINGAGHMEIILTMPSVKSSPSGIFDVEDP